MGTAISVDLRRRIVESYDRGEGTYAEIAESFGIGEATVSRLLRRHREKGDLSPDPHAGGMPAKIGEEELPALQKLVSEGPDRTVEELRQEWTRRSRTRLSRSAMLRALRRAGLTRKKNASDLPSSPASTSTTGGCASCGGRAGSIRDD